MTDNQQNLICLGIIIIVVVVVGWLGQKPPAEPAGLLSLNNKSSLSSEHYSSDKVKLFPQLPVGGQVVGELTAELAFDPKKNEQEQVEKLERYARTQAGNAGANAIVVEMFVQRGHVLYFAGKLVTI